jgi:hypothetical protein
MSLPHPLLPLCKADLIPVEIFSEIFLLTLRIPPLLPWSTTNLMLVCQHWLAIMLSTPGIPSPLTIRKVTQKEVIQAFIQGRKLRLDVRVDMNEEKDGSYFNAESFHACFMAAAQAASRWTSFNLISPPPHGEYKAMQILQPLVRLQSFKAARGCGGLLEPLMTAISRSASPNLTIMELADPVTVHYLVQPACLYVNHFLTTLRIQLPKRMDSPVDILPHLHRLATFEARNLYLPFYPPDASLPLTYTLRSLKLKSVSIQWMAGHVFPFLEKCNIEFTHRTDIIQAVLPVTLLSCSYLLYHSNDLHPLSQFHLPSLSELNVKCGQWNVWRGNPHLAALCPVVSAGASNLRELCLDVTCSEQLLVYMLSLVPTLKSLHLKLAHPNALKPTFFKAFLVREPNANGAYDMVWPPGRAVAPLCPSLVSLHLQYRRWLRGPDKKEPLVAFSDIMASQNLETYDLFKLTLKFDESEKWMANWSIHTPVRKSQHVKRAHLILGILVPDGIIPISTELPWHGLVSLPFKAAEYLCLCPSVFHPPFEFDFLFNYDHMGLMTYYDRRSSRPTSLPCALPLFLCSRSWLWKPLILHFWLVTPFISSRDAGW